LNLRQYNYIKDLKPDDGDFNLTIEILHRYSWPSVVVQIPAMKKDEKYEI